MSARNPERRTPTHATLRRLVMAGNLLALAARGHQLNTAVDLPNLWDGALDALRADLADPGKRPCHTRGSAACRESAP